MLYNQVLIRINYLDFLLSIIYKMFLVKGDNKYTSYSFRNVILLQFSKLFKEPYKDSLILRKSYLIKNYKLESMKQSKLYLK